MTQNLPATRDPETGMTAGGGLELHVDHHDPQHQEIQQNLAVALVPLALIMLLILAFVAAAWTFLAAQPAA